MKRVVTGVLAFGAVFTVGAHADSDVGGHVHAGSSDHHSMHDQLSDKPWEIYGALYASLQSNDAGDALSHGGNKSQANTQNPRLFLVRGDSSPFSGVFHGLPPRLSSWRREHGRVYISFMPAVQATPVIEAVFGRTSPGGISYRC